MNIKDKSIVYEMANSKDPEDIIMATQRSLINSMVDIIEGLEKDLGDKIPGMTWPQLKQFIKMVGDKKPTIIHQESAQ